MRKEQKFFLCKLCGNLVALVESAGVPLFCCGEMMMELSPNTADAAKEKHIPTVKVSGSEVYVEVGSVSHPMQPEHHIPWIYLQTEKGGQRKHLAVPGEAKTRFIMTDDDKPLVVFSYCNLHGLWKTMC